MNIGQFRFGGRKRKRWALFVLLALAILEPIVCIVWLVRVATKNERMANQQLLEVSREDRVTAVTARLEREFSLFLDAIEEVRRENGRNAIHTLLQEKRANAFVDLEIEHPEWGGSEAEAAIRWAQERLALVRNAESDTAKLEVLAEALADPRSQQSISRSGRSYAGLMALLAMELGGAQSIRERVDEVVFDFDAFSMRRQQRRLLLERHSEIFGSERSSLLAEAEAMSSALEEMSSTGRLESGGLGEFEGGYFMVDRLGGYAASLSKETFDSIVDRAMDFSEDSMGLTLQLHDPSALVGAVQRIIVLDKPLYGWRLSVDWDESEEGIAGSSFGYIGVVSIVIGFSIGIAVVLAGALRKEIAVAQLKNDLVATVSHELKTPVASIRLLVDTLNEKEKLDTVRAKEYLQLISKENRRLGQLIENFLSFSRMERDKNSFHLEGVDVRDLLAQSEEVFRDRRTAEDFDLLVECPDEVEPILADKDAMLTAVSNLLENAYKYGGDDRKILLRAKPVNEGVWVEVEDFGEGIPKSERQKIFDRFDRGKHTAGPNSGGVGLGLSIVSFIMAKHGGRVELESEEGKGSVFKLLIPYA